LVKLHTLPLMTCQFRCGKPSGDGPLVCMCQQNLSVDAVSTASQYFVSFPQPMAEKREK